MMTPPPSMVMDHALYFVVSLLWLREISGVAVAASASRIESCGSCPSQVTGTGRDWQCNTTTVLADKACRPRDVKPQRIESFNCLKNKKLKYGGMCPDLQVLTSAAIQPKPPRCTVRPPKNTAILADRCGAQCLPGRPRNIIIGLDFELDTSLKAHIRGQPRVALRFDIRLSITWKAPSCGLPPTGYVVSVTSDGERETVFLPPSQTHFTFQCDMTSAAGGREYPRWRLFDFYYCSNHTDVICPNFNTDARAYRKTATIQVVSLPRKRNTIKCQTSTATQELYSCKDLGKNPGVPCSYPNDFPSYHLPTVGNMVTSRHPVTPNGLKVPVTTSQSATRHVSTLYPSHGNKHEVESGSSTPSANTEKLQGSERSPAHEAIDPSAVLKPSSAASVNQTTRRQSGHSGSVGTINRTDLVPCPGCSGPTLPVDRTALAVDRTAEPKSFNLIIVILVGVILLAMLCVPIYKRMRLTGKDPPEVSTDIHDQLPASIQFTGMLSGPVCQQMLTVYVSYSRNTLASEKALIDWMSTWLHLAGVKVVIDYYYEHEDEFNNDPAAWIGQQVETCDFTIVVCSRSLVENWQATDHDAEEVNFNRATFEARLLRNLMIYKPTSVIPVLLSTPDQSPPSRCNVPFMLRTRTMFELFFDLETEMIVWGDADSLLMQLYGDEVLSCQPAHVHPSPRVDESTNVVSVPAQGDARQKSDQQLSTKITSKSHRSALHESGSESWDNNPSKFLPISPAPCAYQTVQVVHPHATAVACSVEQRRTPEERSASPWQQSTSYVNTRASSPVSLQYVHMESAL
eukprot:scpid26768/ scgid2042/ 